MRKILTLICIAASLNLFAQKEKRYTPAYFMSGELTSADSFNRFINVAIPDFQLKSFDSSDRSKWDFTYTNGKESLLITYYLETTIILSPGGKSKKRNLTNVELRSDFDVLAKIYNRMYKTDISAKDLQNSLPMRGPIYYGFSDYKWNTGNYWFSLAYFEGDGYCMLFRKIG